MSMESATTENDAQEQAPKTRRLTKTKARLLRYIATETVFKGGATCSKQELATLVERNVKTVNRTIAELRNDGLIEVEMNYDERGGQISSTYRAVLDRCRGYLDQGILGVRPGDRES